MPISTTLAAIERDIENGDLGKARQRLHGLVSSYPDDLSLRRRLGEVYAALRYPAMAGRYWYLEEEKTAAMAAACAAFERSCGNDPLQILLALKYRGDLDLIRETYAGRTLHALEAQARAKHRFAPSLVRTGRETPAQPGRQARSTNILILAGCVLFGLLALGLMVVGIVTVIARLAG